MDPLWLRIRRRTIWSHLRKFRAFYLILVLPYIWILRTVFECKECSPSSHNHLYSRNDGYDCQCPHGLYPMSETSIRNTIELGCPIRCPPSTIPETIEVRERPGELSERMTGEEIMLKLIGLDGINDTASGFAKTGEEVSLLGTTTPSGAGGRCSSVNFAALSRSMVCGAPFSSPCFNRDRCRDNGPLIYVYDATCSLAPSSALPPSNESLMLSHSWREAARKAGVLAERYEDACLFISINKNTPCATSSPLWNGGANHVMVDLTDRARDSKPEITESSAMDASSYMLSCYYRSGYDFSVPLRHKIDSRNLTHVHPWDREYFLTVKGNLYLSGYGVDERLSLVPLHSEPEGIVMALNCFELHGEHLLPQNLEFCNALNETSSRHDYDDIMNTTFGLVPAGRSPATYRLAEVMSAGAIPVFVNRDYVRPFPERVDWSSFSFVFPPEEVGRSMMETLRAVSPKELWDMQGKSLEAFLDIFGQEPGYTRIAGVVIEELVRRVGYQ